MLSKEEHDALAHLIAREDIIFCTADKGNSVVIMDKNDYINKLLSIVCDSTKFCELKDDPTDKRESRLQNFLYSLKKKGCLDVATYQQIRPTGSQPARLYGLPKTHKDGTPVRPIVSCLNTYTYELAKYLVRILQPL